MSVQFLNNALCKGQGELKAHLLGAINSLQQIRMVLQKTTCTSVEYFYRIVMSNKRIYKYIIYKNQCL